MGDMNSNAEGDGNNAETLSDISESVSAVRELIEEQGSQQSAQQQAFDALYEELRQYKDDFIFQAEKPLLLDLLLFYDSLTWFQQSLVKQEMSPDVVADSFQYLIDEFLELLYRRDVVPVESHATFARESQKAIKVIATGDPDLDYKVQQVLKRGFARAGRVLRPEEVVIHRLNSNAGHSD